VEPIATKEIAFAAMGGASGIAGLLLVFVGFIVVKVEALPSTTADNVIRRYEIIAKVGMLPLVVLVAVILAAYGWLFSPSNSVLFYTWSVGFVVGMGLFVLYSVYAVVVI
jgi:hypothetical protein